MTVDYKIKIESGGVSITQHVDGAAPEVSGKSKANSGMLTLLGTSFASSKAAAAARAAGQGGNAPGDIGGGGNPPGDIGGGGNAPGDIGGGGGAPAQGQIVIFGPVVVDATGLVHKCLTEEPSKEKHGEKRHGDATTA
jgi:hypothetical protein